MPAFAYATSEDAATVTVIDLDRRRAVKTLPAGPGAHSLALAPDSSRLYVANRRDHAVTVVDTTRAEVEDTLELSGPPAGVAVSPDGTRLAIVGRTRLVAWVLEIGRGVAPQEIHLVSGGQDERAPRSDGPVSTHPVWSSDGRTLYVEDNVHATLVRVDVVRGAVVGTTRLPSAAHMVYEDHAAGRVYALCTGNSSADVPPSVAVVDSRTGALIATVPVRLADGETGELHHGAFDPNGQRLFVANMGEGRPRGGRSLHVLDTDELRFTARLEARAGAGHPVVSPDANRLFLVNHSAPVISVFDLESLALVGEVVLPGVRSMGHGCLFTEDGAAFWAVSNSAGQALAIDAQRLEVVATVPTGPGTQEIARTWSDAFS